MKLRKKEIKEHVEESKIKRRETEKESRSKLNEPNNELQDFKEHTKAKKNIKKQYLRFKYFYFNI